MALAMGVVMSMVATKPETMPESLRGKAVLVTGGTTGIGRTLAKQFAQEGANVLIFGRHQRELDEALSQMSSTVRGLVADQAKQQDLETVFRYVDEQLGALDVLIGNAGIEAGSVSEANYTEMVYAMQTDLIAHMACCHEAIRRMKARGQGDIVLVGSMSAVSRGAGSDIYVAAKAGMAGFADALRKQVMKDGIRVILVEPGNVGTDMTASDHSPAEQAEMARRGEMMLTEDVADCIRYALTRPRRCDVIHIRVQEHCTDD